MSEKGLSLVRPENGGNFSNFTMGPNWIYDTLLVKESLSVIKVVSYVNRNTVGRTDQEGKRVEIVQASYDTIARKMEMSRRAVGTAMREAVAKGYLIMVKPGRKIGKDGPGEGGWYALNWNWSADNKSYVKQEAGQLERDLPEIEEVEQDLPQDLAQNLPQELEQNLPPCINKVLDLNKSLEIKGRKRRFSSTVNPNSTEAKSDKRKGSTAIGSLIADLTREFGDEGRLALPNIGRALNLWNSSGLSEQDFIGLVYQARQKTLASGMIQHRKLVANGKGYSSPNRMPYFFAVLGDLISPQRTQRGTEGINIVSVSSVEDAAKIVAGEDVAEQVDSGVLWKKLELGWLAERKREALRQAELLVRFEDKGRTRARFGLKFARPVLLAAWEISRLELALEAELGLKRNSATLEVIEADEFEPVAELAANF
jgi:hypothetical protein